MKLSCYTQRRGSRSGLVAATVAIVVAAMPVARALRRQGRLAQRNLHTEITVHELGHTLQLGHGLALSCKDGNGEPVALSASCEVIPYGDPHNAMGSGQGSFSAIQQYDLGWLGGRIANVPSTVGTYRLLPLEVDDLGTQVLRLVDGNAILWLEYRAPLGVDSYLGPGSAGLFIRREQPAAGLESFLLDMTPGSPAGYWDARLPVGATWANPLGTTKITVNSADSTGLWVKNCIHPANRAERKGRDDLRDVGQVDRGRLPAGPSAHGHRLLLRIYRAGQEPEPFRREAREPRYSGRRFGEQGAHHDRLPVTTEPRSQAWVASEASGIRFVLVDECSAGDPAAY